MRGRCLRDGRFKFNYVFLQDSQFGHEQAHDTHGDSDHGGIAREQAGRADARSIEFVRAAGVRPRHNGLRDSYASFRMAEPGEAGKVAQEAGDNEAIVRRTYREIRLPDGRVITPQLAHRADRTSEICQELGKPSKTQ